MASAQKSTRQSRPSSSLISDYFKKAESPRERPGVTRSPCTHEGISVPLVSTDGDELGPTPKRARVQSPPRNSNGTPSAEVNALDILMSPQFKEFRPPPESPRTARYKYSAKYVAEDHEMMTPEQLARKKLVHEKFIQKLGRPESLNRKRQRSNAESPKEDDEEEQFEQGEEEEKEEEEEEEPITKSLRGKYAATSAKEKDIAKSGSIASKTKLTPLERQFVDIKKQYPDTLLLLEVGYKFRFFGEDAKV